MQILELCESCDAKAHPSHGSILEFGRAPGIFDSEYGRCGCAVGIICAGTSAVYAFLACVYSRLIAVDTAAKGRSSGAGVFREPHSLVQGVQFSGIQPQLHIVAPRTTFERGSYEHKVSPHEFRRWMISSRIPISSRSGSGCCRPKVLMVIT